MGYLFRIRQPLIFLFKLHLGFCNMLDSADTVQRQPDDSRLLGKGLQDCLPYPPHPIGDELEILLLVKPFCRSDKSEVSFIDNITQWQTLVLIISAYTDDKTEICFHQGIQGFLVPFPNSYR